MKKKVLIALLVLVFSLTLAVPAPALSQSDLTTFHVQPTSSGSGDGSDWANACTLQYALTNATSGDEIWVAEGIYKPTGGTNRYATFNLVSHVALYGGFAGDETTRDERDWVVNQTILSGNIGQLNDASDNSYHVVTSLDTNEAILDGFTVTSGNASWWPNNTGGGIYQNKGTLTVNNCIIYGNTAALRGGGISLADGKLTLINSIVNGNTSNAEGGGIRAGGACELIIINSTIVNNTANTEGGGIRLGQTNVITNSIVWGNDASEGDQVYQPSGVQTNTVTYSVVEGEYNGGAYPGDGNINQDPQFVSAYDNLRLQASSPAIDAGNNKAVPKGVTDDLDGNPRIVNRTVDMGAFEYLTAQQADTLDLIEQVGELVDNEVLNPGQGNSLIVKLEGAFDKMYRNAKTAIYQLEAFINQVEDFIEEGILTEAEGQDLIGDANEIIGAL